MEILDFDLKQPLHFNWTGKFVAPDENWIHMTRELTDFELIIMTKGTLYLGEGNNEVIVHEGEYRIVCPTSFQHGTRPSACSFYWVHFSYHNFKNDPKRFSSDLLEPVGADESRILLPVQARIPRIDRLIVLLKQLQDCNQKYRNMNLNNYALTAILCELYGQLYLSGGKVAMRDGQVQLYSDILDYITWRVRENIKVSEIAEYFGYNAKYITTFFKKACGISLKQYILNRKIELAKALLTDTNEPVSQIGYDIGFTDNHNFSNTFKRLTGQTPSEYRNSYAQRMLFHQ